MIAVQIKGQSVCRNSNKIVIGRNPNGQCAVIVKWYVVLFVATNAVRSIDQMLFSLTKWYYYLL